VTALPQLPVQIIQHDVRQDRRQRGALWRPFNRRLLDPVDHHPGLQIPPDEPEDLAVVHLARHPRHQHIELNPVLAATVFAHESAAFGVHVLAGAGGDVRPGCRAGVGSGCAEEAGQRGDGFEQQGVSAGLLVGGAAGAELS